MDTDVLRKQLEIDEGCVLSIYKDHLGYPTFGIGHLVLESDPEHGKPVGTAVSETRMLEAFDHDVVSVVADCHILYPDFEALPEEAQQIIGNMMFNMGRTRLSKFKNMKRAVDARQWKTASVEMMDSAWYRQVPNRAQRLVDRMSAIG